MAATPDKGKTRKTRKTQLENELAKFTRQIANRVSQLNREICAAENLYDNSVTSGHRIIKEDKVEAARKPWEDFRVWLSKHLTPPGVVLPPGSPPPGQPNPPFSDGAGGVFDAEILDVELVHYDEATQLPVEVPPPINQYVAAVKVRGLFRAKPGHSDEYSSKSSSSGVPPR